MRLILHVVLCTCAFSLEASSRVLTFNLSNFHNVQYSLEVTLGSPPQAFLLMLESFSSWLWVPSIDCAVPTLTQTFDPSQSTTYRSMRTNVNLNYYGAGCSGDLSTDTLRLNDSSYSLQIPTQEFLLVDYESPLMQFLQADGFLGLGMTEGRTGLVQDMFTRGLIPAAVFSLYLGDNKFGYEETNPRSVLTLGASFPRKYATTAFTYFPLALENVWSVPLTQVRVGSAVMPLTESRVAEFDVGTDVLVLFEDDYEWVVTQIAAAGSCRIKGITGVPMCDCLAQYDISDYPDLRLTLNDMQVTLKPQQYFFLQNNFCLLLMMSSNSETWVLGSTFLRGYYMEFDFTQQRVGIAPAITSSVVPDHTTALIWGIILLTLMSIGLSYVIFKAFQTRRRRARDQLLPQNG